jgi:hypothetical protein
MDHVKIIEIIATVLTLIGIPLMSIPRRIGMWILMVATIFWLIFAYLTSYNFFLVQNIYILFFDIYALWSWKKLGIKFI